MAEMPRFEKKSALYASAESVNWRSTDCDTPMHCMGNIAFLLFLFQIKISPIISDKTAFLKEISHDLNHLLSLEFICTWNTVTYFAVFRILLIFIHIKITFSELICTWNNVTFFAVFRIPLIFIHIKIPISKDFRNK